ncbi:MAG: hypothetical protein HDS78_03300 [Bacteroidales bacterium]|nr:hypothetical protein [Bacteroidales bacterium]
MSKKVIDRELLNSDIRSVSARVRALKTKITKARNENDLYSRVELIFKNHGYNYTLNKTTGRFLIDSTNFFIVGDIDSTMVKFGLVIRFGGSESSYLHANCGMVNFPIIDIETYLPLIDRMIAESNALTEKYENLRRKEMSGELLEVLVREYLKGISNININNIYVNTDDEGINWLLMNVDSDKLVRAPIDIDNYKSLCDAWLKVVNDEELWKIEHKETQVQVLEANHSYGTRVDWRNMATGEWYYNLKV